MPIDDNRAYLLRCCCVGLAVPQAPVLTLGVKKVTSDSDPFHELGLSQTESVDISAYEGCTHLADLNVSPIPNHLRQRFGLIYNGGTLEHIFDTHAALRSLHEMLLPGGLIVHVGPLNGWVDHGFYQFSPTLFSDYYRANKYEAIRGYMLRALSADHSELEVISYAPGMLDGGAGGTMDGCWSFFMVYRKTDLSTADAVPQQRLYVRMHSGDASLTDHPSFEKSERFRLRRGHVVPVDVQHPPVNSRHLWSSFWDLLRRRAGRSSPAK